jgi:hypothetical protein
MNDDAQHLDLLSIFHYIVGGLAFLFSFFPVFHLWMGIMMVTGTFSEESGSDNVPVAFGWFFIVVALGAILIGLTYAICTILAGRYLKRRERHTFCLVMAAISCIFFPFGTVLGIFTILVLSRPSVKALFATGRSTAGL